MNETAREPVLVDLALQGGGSHGAFTWGVLDRLIEEPWLRLEAISGTSAGAMNAALVADGWTQGGVEGAKAALDTYWRRVSQAAVFSPLQRSPLDRLMGRWTLDTSPAYIAMDLMARVVSPYDLNPLGLNPLRTVLAESIDFDRLARAPAAPPCIHPCVRHQGRIHRARRRAGDRFYPQPRLLDQPIEHAPSERAVGTAALQSEIHQNRFACCCVHRHPPAGDETAPIQGEPTTPRIDPS